MLTHWEGGKTEYVAREKVPVVEHWPKMNQRIKAKYLSFLQSKYKPSKAIEFKHFSFLYNTFNIYMSHES